MSSSEGSDRNTTTKTDPELSKQWNNQWKWHAYRVWLNFKFVFVKKDIPVVDLM